MRKEALKSLQEYCHFVNGMMVTKLKGEDLRDAYNMFRVALLDGHVPLNKAIGFKLFSSMNMEDLAVIDRHTSCLENMVELSKNVARVVFLSETGFSVTSQECTGDVLAGTAKFSSDGKSVKVLDESCYLFNATEPLGIRLFVCENTGYHSMEENVELMKTIYPGNPDENSTYFPLYTDHTLVDYISVLPFQGNYIKYRLRNGFAEEDLKTLWSRYMGRMVV